MRVLNLSVKEARRRMRLIETDEYEMVECGHIPNHVALIMDGNGRWATFRGKSRTSGHFAAQDAILAAIDSALSIGVRWLTFYTFSTENWIRPPSEVNVLMSFATWFFSPKIVKRLNAAGVRLDVVGDLDDTRVPVDVRKRFRKICSVTQGNDRLRMVLAFNYGGRAELFSAIQRAVLLSRAEDIEDLEVDDVRKWMYIPEMPDIDLLVRTSGEQRLSNFFPWHSAYAELLFLDTLWPDFTIGHFYSAVHEYQQRRRRFGGV